MRDIPTDPRSNRAWKSELLRGWKIFSFTSKSREDTKEANIVLKNHKTVLKKHTVETAIQLCENSDATAKENCSGYDSTTGNSSIFSQDLTLWRNEATLSAVVRFVEGCWGFPSARVSPVDTRVPQQISLERSRLCSAYYITIWACRPYPYLVNRTKSAYATRFLTEPTS